MSPIGDEGGYPGEYSLETTILQENTRLRAELEKALARIKKLEAMLYEATEWAPEPRE